MDRQTIIDQMWNNRIKNRGGGSSICNTCRGNYSWKCSCARARYNPSDSEIERYRAKKMSLILETQKRKIDNTESN